MNRSPHLSLKIQPIHIDLRFLLNLTQNFKDHSFASWHDANVALFGHIDDDVTLKIIDNRCASFS